MYSLPFPSLLTGWNAGPGCDGEVKGEHLKTSKQYQWWWAFMMHVRRPKLKESCCSIFKSNTVHSIALWRHLTRGSGNTGAILCVTHAVVRKNDHNVRYTRGKTHSVKQVYYLVILEQYVRQVNLIPLQAIATTHLRNKR